MRTRRLTLRPLLAVAGALAVAATPEAHAQTAARPPLTSAIEAPAALVGLIGAVDPPTPSTSPTPTPTTAQPTTSAPGSGGGLPITGAPVAVVVTPGAVMIVLGVFLVQAARRRRET